MKSIYLKQKQIWKEQNEKYFGISPIEDYSDSNKVNQYLKEVADKFWNNGTNKFKELLETGGKLNDADKLVPGSYELFYNDQTDLTHVIAEFKLPEDYKHSAVAMRQAKLEGLEKPLTKRITIAYLPSPTDLCWLINGTKYILRIDASPNYDLIRRIDETTWKQQNNWTYNSEIDEFSKRSRTIKPYEGLSEENKYFLEEIWGSEIKSEEDFKEALKALPIYDSLSAAYFKYDYVNAKFEFVKNSSRFANPLKYVPINISVPKMLLAQKIYKKQNDSGEESAASLIITHNNIFSLEMSRTIVYDSKFNSTFNFTDSAKVFDAFKTSTNKAAGRTRLLLDNITVDNGLLWFEKEDGEKVSQYKAIFDDSIEVKENLSVISNSSFNTNNDPKRIMMTAKLRAQAVPVVGEEDDFSHDVSARIVFADYEGYNYGDAIIISRSFARKLSAKYTQQRRLKTKSYNMITEKYDLGDEIEIEDYMKATGANADANYRDIVLEGIAEDSIHVSAIAPFGVGDKLTNFHGSKGICCMIMEDDEMPYLVNDLGPNMKAGPMEVIASGLSVFRRKSLGQIFEAFALATGKTDVKNANEAIDKYYDEMKEYGEKSIVEFKGQRSVKPVGLNKFIRLNHDSVSKQSFSELKSNYGKMLKFGEMELLALAALGAEAVINELDIRSISKHANAFSRVKQMQETNKDHFEVANNLRYFNIMRSMGVQFEIGNESKKKQKLDDISRIAISKMGYVDEDVFDIFD